MLFLSEWEITFLCPIEHSQNQYSKSNLENLKNCLFFPGKLGYRDPDHQRTKKAAIHFYQRQNPDGGSKPLIPSPSLELFINIVKCFLVLYIFQLFWCGVVWFGLVWFGYLEELVLRVGAGNIPPYHLK